MKLELLIESLLSNELESTIPFAITFLKENMFVKAKFYEGDLLMTVLAINESFWTRNQDQWKEIIEVLEIQESRITELEVSFEMKVDWYEKIERFKSISF